MEHILSQIDKKKLIINRWYLGRGRNSNIGFWTGEVFLTLGFKIDQWRIKEEEFYHEKEGCFQPFLLLDEGKVIEPTGESPWEAHYAKKLSVKL